MEQKNRLRPRKERAPVLASVSLILPVGGILVVNLGFLVFPAFVLPLFCLCILGLAAFAASLALAERLRWLAWAGLAVNTFFLIIFGIYLPVSIAMWLSRR